ncbi:N-acetylmuramoyl-L-alanine amidase, partial [Streptomyces noursei]
EVPGTDHTDPGPHWDWDRYLALVRAELRRPAGRA